MKFLSWIFIFSLVCFLSCQGKKTGYPKEDQGTPAVLDESEDSFNVKEDSENQKDKEKPKEPIEKAPAIDSQDQDQTIEDETAQATEDETAQATEDEITQTTEDETQMAESKCNIHNYKEYVYDYKKMNRLIAETGQGCYLPGADFSNKDLSYMIFTQSNMRGVILKNSIVTGTKFIKVDCTGCALEDSNYMEAHWRGALLKTATYNWYDPIVAWIRKLSGQGIRNPKGKGMIYTGE